MTDLGQRVLHPIDKHKNKRHQLHVFIQLQSCLLASQMLVVLSLLRFPGKGTKEH